MLKKLIKYDLQWINRVMVIYFAITVILSILTRIASNFTGSVMGDLVFGILRGVTIGAFCSTIINAVIRIWVRFRQNNYKDEAYLTHTLPIERGTIFDSKIISSIISILISAAVVIVCFFIAFWNNDIYEYVRHTLEMEDMPFIMVSILLTLIIETIYAIIVGIFGLVIGHRNNNNRMVLSVIIGIVTYFVLQSLPVVAIFIAGLFDKNLMGLFSDSTDVAPSMSILRSLLIISNVSYIAIIIALYFSSKKLFNRGFDVE